MNIIKVFWVFPVCLALLTAGCENKGSAASGLYRQMAMTEQNLSGTWRLAYWVKDDGTRHAPVLGGDGKGLSVRFTEDGRLMLTNGCNVMSARFSVGQGKLDIGPLAATRKLCEPALMQADALAARLLRTENGFRLERFVDALPSGTEWVVETDGGQYRFVRIDG